MAFNSGKTASVTISATARPYDTFSLKFSNEIVDTTNFTSSGYQENVAGVFKCDVSFSGPYDGAEGLTQGQGVTVTFATGGAVSFAMPTRISDIEISTATRNKADQIAVSATSNGTFTVTF